MIPRESHVVAFARRGALVVVLFLAGCGGSGWLPVSGTVTHDGQPVAYGTVSFAPDTAHGASGPQGSAEIRNGRYQTDADKGPVAGPHVVRITGWKSAPETGILGPPAFSDYTSKVDISAGNSQLDFDIPTTPRK